VAHISTRTPSPGTSEQAHRARLAAFFDRFAPEDQRWRRKNRAYHDLVESACRFIVPPGARVLEIGSGSGDLLASLHPDRGLGVDLSSGMVEAARARHPELEFRVGSGERMELDEQFDYVVLSDLVPYAYDLVRLLQSVRAVSHDRTRLIVSSYSLLWRPVIRAAELLRLKREKPIVNWVTAGDVTNALDLAGFEVVSVTPRILFPKHIPFVSTFLNGVLGALWPFTHLCLTWWVVARPKNLDERPASVSVIVPCRNEQGNIAAIVERMPALGTEIVFVEGGSTDDTRAEVSRQIDAHPELDISLHVQTGKGKADAVRLGFERASGDLLMILDADLSVDPEELTIFAEALISGAADFANGSRLVYQMEPGAMQQLNVLGNKFFSHVFTWLIGQEVKDTLCGTKALWAADYRAIASGRDELAKGDPFGDFDLLLGAARRGLKIVDVPVRYRARTYGSTNISRFRHGLLLLKMSGVAFRSFKIHPMRT
jgi:SAM-dependent methyltransferase